jgi:archaellum component FlaC
VLQQHLIEKMQSNSNSLDWKEKMDLVECVDSFLSKFSAKLEHNDGKILDAAFKYLVNIVSEYIAMLKHITEAISTDFNTIMNV